MRPDMKPIATLILFLLTVPLLAAQTQPISIEEPDNPLYIIQPNDILEIFVYEEPELTRKVLVRPDGRISFPLVQDLRLQAYIPEN